MMEGHRVRVHLLDGDKKEGVLNQMTNEGVHIRDQYGMQDDKWFFPMGQIKRIDDLGPERRF